MSVEDEIKLLTVAVNKMDKKVDIFIVKNEAQAEDVETLKKDVNGNGKMGMKTKVGVMWIFLSVIGGAAIIGLVGIGVKKIFGA